MTDTADILRDGDADDVAILLRYIADDLGVSYLRIAKRINIDANSLRRFAKREIKRPEKDDILVNMIDYIIKNFSDHHFQNNTQVVARYRGIVNYYRSMGSGYERTFNLSSIRDIFPKISNDDIYELRSEYFGNYIIYRYSRFGDGKIVRALLSISGDPEIPFFINSYRDYSKKSINTQGYVAHSPGSINLIGHVSSDAVLKLIVFAKTARDDDPTPLRINMLNGLVLSNDFGGEWFAARCVAIKTEEDVLGQLTGIFHPDELDAKHRDEWEQVADRVSNETSEKAVLMMYGRDLPH